MAKWSFEEPLEDYIAKATEKAQLIKDKYPVFYSTFIYSMWYSQDKDSFWTESKYKATISSLAEFLDNLDTDDVKSELRKENIEIDSYIGVANLIASFLSFNKAALGGTQRHASYTIHYALRPIKRGKGAPYELVSGYYYANGLNYWLIDPFGEIVYQSIVNTYIYSDPKEYRFMALVLDSVSAEFASKE